MAPAAADAARDYLGRVEALYPHQVLGLVRAGERYYLLNSRDVEWGDRTRLYLLALRLHDAGGSSILRPTVDHNIAPAERHERGQPYGAPERQALGVMPGGSPPAGSFICLAPSRAEREGLARTQRGEIVLAAGQSVHLVDPQEPQVAVEVQAARDRPLNLGDIFQRSTRAGIYAGLTGGPAGQPGGSATIERPDGTVIFRTASVGASAAETRVATHEQGLRGQTTKQDIDDLNDTVATLSGLSPKPPVTAPAPAPVAVDAGPAAVPKPEPATVIAAVTADRAPPSPEAHAAPAPEPPPAAKLPEIVVSPAPVESALPAAAAAPAAVAAIPLAPAAPVVQPAAPAAAVPPVAETTARAEIRVPAGTAVAPAPPDAGQPYDDYAKAMKTLMALKRSGGVRSVGEMTYVHPAVEVFRRQNP